MNNLDDPSTTLPTVLEAASRLAAIVDTRDAIATDPNYCADRSPRMDQYRAETFAKALREYREAVAREESVQ